MNTETVVFFYVQEKVIGRKYPWQKVQFQIQETKWCNRRLVAAGIPEYDFTKRPWKKETLRKKIRAEMIPAFQIEFWESTVFLYHKCMHGTEMGRLLEEIFPLEIISIPGKKGYARLTPEDIIESLMDEFCRYDALVILDGTVSIGSQIYAAANDWQDSIFMQIDLPEFISRHCENVNYLAVITADAGRYVEVFEEVNEEYGLTGLWLQSTEQLKLSAKYKVLVVDAGLEEKRTWRYLPSGCTYLDLLSDPERQRIIAARRKDVRYISFYRQIEKKLKQKIQFLGIHP